MSDMVWSSCSKNVPVKCVESGNQGGGGSATNSGWPIGLGGATESWRMRAPTVASTGIDEVRPALFAVAMRHVGMFQAIRIGSALVASR